MSKPIPTPMGAHPGLLRWGAFATVALVAAATWATLSVIAGSDIGVVLGHAPDPHHVTAWAWRILFSSCSKPTHCLHLANTALFAILAGLVAFAASGRNRSGVLPGIACGLAVAVSPLAAGLLSGALGGESSIALMLFAFLLVDAMDTKPRSLALQCVATAALVLQDVRFAPALLLYALVHAAHDEPHWTRLIRIAVTCSATAFSLALYIPRYDAASGAEIAIVAGILLFLVLPIALYASRLGLYRRLGWDRGGVAATPLLMGGFTLAMGVLAVRDSISIYFMAAQIAVLLTLSRKVQFEVKPQLWAALAGTGLAIAGIVSVVWVPAPALADAREAAVLRTAIVQAAPKNLCILTDATGSGLIDENFAKLYAGAGQSVAIGQSVRACTSRATNGGSLLEARAGTITDWGPNGVPLALAAEAAEGASAPFDAARGSVFPKTTTMLPGHSGAFTSTIRTPLGKQPTLTIVAGYGYRIDCLRLTEPKTLTFAFGNPIADTPGADPVRLRVDVLANGIAEAHMTRDLRPIKSKGTPPWFYYSKKLRSARGCTSLTFKAIPYTGKAHATWVTLVAPVIR